MRTVRAGAGRKRGNSLVEVALIMPWIVFLFIGVFDFGFWAYAAISVENAARVAALYTSSSPSATTDSARACQLVLSDLVKMPNHPASCAVGVSACAGMLCVEATQLTTIDGALASEVVVRYELIPLIPIPGILDQTHIQRRTVMRVRSS